MKVHPFKVAVIVESTNERAPPLCKVPRMTEETGECLDFVGKILHILKATYTISRIAKVLRSIGRKLTGCQMNLIIIDCVNCTSILFKHESKKKRRVRKAKKKRLENEINGSSQRRIAAGHSPPKFCCHKCKDRAPHRSPVSIGVGFHNTMRAECKQVWSEIQKGKEAN